MQVETFFGKRTYVIRVAVGGSIFPHRLAVTRLPSHATTINVHSLDRWQDLEDQYGQKPR